jgi:hypothetical protein
MDIKTLIKEYINEGYTIEELSKLFEEALNSNNFMDSIDEEIYDAFDSYEHGDDSALSYSLAANIATLVAFRNNPSWSSETLTKFKDTIIKEFELCEKYYNNPKAIIDWFI